MKILSIILFLLVSNFTFGQTPFSKENTNNTFAVKGIAYINLFDGGFGSIVRVEKGFFKNHSLGGKLIYNFFTPHRENTADKTYEVIDFTDNIDKSIILEYKYYFDFRNFRQGSGVSFYSSINYKTGKYH